MMVVTLILTTWFDCIIQTFLVTCDFLLDSLE